VRATKAPGKASQPLPSTRVRRAKVAIPGRIHAIQTTVSYDRRHIEGAQRRRVNDGAEPRRARRVILELGVAGPPAGIQAPGQPAQLDGVMEAVELAGMIVERRQDRCRARSGRSRGVEEEQGGGHDGSAHAWNHTA
jgi:hypothetical protein